MNCLMKTRGVIYIIIYIYIIIRKYIYIIYKPLKVDIPVIPPAMEVYWIYM